MAYPHVQIIGSSGGTISPGDGFQIVIPSGMFSSNARLVIEAPITPGSSPPNRTTAGSAYRVTQTSGPSPDSTKRFTVKVPFSSAFEQYRSQLNVHYNVSHVDPGGWMPAPERVDDGTQGIMGGRFNGNYLLGYHCVFKGPTS